VILRVSGVRCQVSGNEEKRLTTDDGSRTRDEEPESRVQFPVSSFQFQVSDTGIGIPKERIEAIFEPFAKVDIEGRWTEGTGLGLAISRRLIELMGGKLTVESQVNKGSTFTVELEIEVMEGVEEAAKAPEKVVIGYRGERKHILIADDNITNLSMLVSMLKPLGFEIETAENGEEAVGRAAESQPDLILMDLMMPIMNGDEALRRIRENEDLKKIKVIGVSAAVADKDRADAFAADCDGFISKPVETGTLMDKLKAQLQIEWIEQVDEERRMKDEGRGTRDEETVAVKIPPQAVLEQIIQHAERGEFTRLESTIDELEAEDSNYSDFCDRIRAHARKYDDEGIIKYIKSREGWD
jgi:CheY-like chemotaxis protein